MAFEIILIILPTFLDTLLWNIFAIATKTKTNYATQKFKNEIALQPTDNKQRIIKRVLACVLQIAGFFIFIFCHCCNIINQKVI